MARFPRFNPGQAFGLRDSSGSLVLDHRSADLFNRAKAELIRLGHVSAIAPLTWTEEETGRKMSLALTPEIWAKLSGSSNPYDFVEQIYDPGTDTWSDKPGGVTETANAYESKGKTGLSGKTVRLTYEPEADDWRFQYVGHACVGDASHVCICTCGTPYPTTATITDDLGTWTMTYQTLLPPTGWQQLGLAFPVADTYVSDGHGGCGGLGPGCPFGSPPGCNTPYGYKLIFNCVAQTWTLQMWANTIGCGAAGTRWSKNTVSGGSLVVIGSDTIPMDCSNTSMLTFNLPTVTHDGVTAPGHGAVSVVF